MANQHDLDILRQGAEVWNKWRKVNPVKQLDLSEANLSGADLSEADLTGANLSGAILDNVNIRRANLSRATLNFALLIEANLNFANLSSANLGGATLTRATLIGATLTGANLGAFLIGANLSGADLSGASLRNTHLGHANLSGANLSGADLSGAIVGSTTFGDVDLRVVKGLETVEHEGPSTFGIDTIFRSHGKIPEVFLRKAGVQETFLTNMRALVDSMRPIDFYSCFISYSSKDQSFAERLYADLLSKGVRCWFAPEDLKIGDKFWHRIDESIKLYDKLLVVLSEYSVESEWVEREVIAALEKERQHKKLVLFPIALDEAFKHTIAPWAADLRRQRHIGDFTRWKQHEAYQKAFDRLLHDLKAEAQKMESRDATTNDS